MTTGAKLLSDCGSEYVIDADYKVVIEAGEYLVVEVGAKAGKPVASFKHANIALTQKKLYNFRTYFKSGAKRWYVTAGVSHYFVIPRSKVTLLPEKGYSYVKAVINGVKVSFSVSGCGAGNWTDYLNTQTQISVNHKLSDVKKLAEVAVRGTGLEPVVSKELDDSEKADWENLVARANPDVKVAIFGMVDKGLSPVVKLASGYVFDGRGEGRAESLNRGYRWHDLGDGKKTYQQDGKVKSVLLAIDGWKVWAKVGQIDWAATAKANGLAA